ncbi:hypothetical protein EON65_58895 [archaeon]|nr:MAG: hypothetical protein EON65_58895 [archaeon]
MAPMYYRGAKAAICVFDVTNEESFTHVSTWLRDLKAHADPNVVICLAGNKCDKTATFALAQCEAMAKSMGGTFFRTSAFSGEGIQEIFDTLARRVAEVYRGNKAPSKDYDTLKLGAGNKKAESSGGGCC